MNALVVIGNGRTDYLQLAVSSALEQLPVFDRYLMVDDSGDPNVRELLDYTYPAWTIVHHPENLGMAAAVQTGFDLAADTDWVFWLEEDFLITGRPPTDLAVGVLDDPTVAQVVFRRQPLPHLNPTEARLGCVLATLVEQSDTVRSRELWTEYDGLFSLNPCILPRRVMDLGWDPDNEAGMTAKLRQGGFRFVSWGHPQDGRSWCCHIGERRATQWKL